MQHSNNDVLYNILVIGQEERKDVSQALAGLLYAPQCNTMICFDDGQIHHAVAWFCKVAEEGLVESLFDTTSMDDVENNEKVAVVRVDESVKKMFRIFELKVFQLTMTWACSRNNSDCSQHCGLWRLECREHGEWGSEHSTQYPAYIRAGLVDKALSTRER